ncbi:uncharacterized protein Hap1MRO34_002783 isoform 1-T2 [Clarias gariepinus]|uniref:uncharacterized protein LOC128517109 n=1 Tax=Clarias gariepinus TaxID=13013 RepID=UPI00234D2F54|nr:uncharacterized protein LOC128517109 [Clarias gariepinus]XP_053346871.1 uncharacterized protein LOC128517109 [Clarias gariepinus]
MSRIETLNEMFHLEHSRFGRPTPRHGLKLLYWFANEFLSFDLNNEMFSEYDPDDGVFGFHPFENRYKRNGVKLLPDVDLPYYVVGNLNKPQSNELPLYLREEYTGRYDNSNMDRIIISMNNEWLDKVYVTEHHGRSNYNSDATYRISKGLLKIIQRLSLVDFLWRTGFSEYNVKIPAPIIRSLNINIPQPKQTPVSQMAITAMPSVSSQRSQYTWLDYFLFLLLFFALLALWFSATVKL